MKKVLSLILVLSIVLGSFGFAFAAPSNEDVQKLQDYGVLIGDGSGNLMLDQTLTRAQFAVFATRLTGNTDAEVQALNEKSPFDDVTGYYAPFIGKAYKDGLVSGRGNNKYDPNSDVTYTEALTILMRALGYGSDLTGLAWPSGYFAKAAALGLVDGSIDMNAKITRGQMATAILTALDTDNKDGVKLAVALGYEEADEVEVPAEPEVLEVVSVTALNFAEVEVEYNASVDEDSLSLANVTVGTTELTSTDGSIELLEDGKTVRIFYNAGFTNAQQSKVKVSLVDVESVNGDAFPDVTEVEVTFVDLAFPQIVEVQAIGNRKVNITFSEPIKEDTNALIFANYRIDGNPVVGSGSPKIEGRTIELTLASKLSVGEHKISLAANRIKDYAGFAAGVGEVSFTVNENTTIPTVSLVSATQNRVVIQFDREVMSVTAANVFWKDGNITRAAQQVRRDANDKTKYTVTFDDNNALPLTTTTLFIKGIEDFYGNKPSSDLQLSVQAEADTVRPSVESVESVRENLTVITFSEAIRTNTGTIKITDKDNAVITIDLATAGLTHYTRPGASTADTKTIAVTNVLDTAKNDYTFEIRDVEDMSVLRNKSLQQFFTVKVVDKTRPTVVDSKYKVFASERNIIIEFSEKVDQSTVLDKSNYLYKDTQFGFNSLPGQASISLSADGKTAVISFPQTWRLNGVDKTFTGQIDQPSSQIQISGIKDLAGNTMFTAIIDRDVVGTAPTVSSAVAENKNTIFVNIVNSQPVNVYAADFVVKAGSTTLTVTNAVLVNTTSQKGVRLTIAQDLNANATYGTATPQVVTVELAGNIVLTKDAAGQDITIAAPVNASDSIKPSYKEYTLQGSNTVRIVFNENLGTATGNLAQAFTVKNARTGALLLPGTDYTATPGVNYVDITITRTNFNDRVSVALQNNSVVRDTVLPTGNLANDFAAIETEINVLGPTSAQLIAVAKANLLSAIQAANTNLGSVEISVDGTDVVTTDEWVTQVVYDAYVTAIAAAQTAHDDSAATVATLEAALTALNGATTTFNTAKLPGTL